MDCVKIKGCIGTWISQPSAIPYIVRTFKFFFPSLLNVFSPLLTSSLINVVFNFFLCPLPAIPRRSPVVNEEAAGGKKTEAKRHPENGFWTIVCGPGMEGFLPFPRLLLIRFLYSSHCPGQVQTSSAFQVDPEAIFEHILCLANSPKHKVWTIRSCEFCLHQNTEGCEICYISYIYLISGENAHIVCEYLIPSSCFNESSLLLPHTRTVLCIWAVLAGIPAVSPVSSSGETQLGLHTFHAGELWPGQPGCRRLCSALDYGSCDRTTGEAHKERSIWLSTNNPAPFNLSQVHRWVIQPSGMCPRSWINCVRGRKGSGVLTSNSWLGTSLSENKIH